MNYHGTRHLNRKPCDEQTNTKLVGYSDPHCTLAPFLPSCLILIWCRFRSPLSAGCQPRLLRRPLHPSTPLKHELFHTTAIHSSPVLDKPAASSDRKSLNSCTNPDTTSSARISSKTVRDLSSFIAKETSSKPDISSLSQDLHLTKQELTSSTVTSLGLKSVLPSSSKLEISSSSKDLTKLTSLNREPKHYYADETRLKPDPEIKLKSRLTNPDQVEQVTKRRKEIAAPVPIEVNVEIIAKNSDSVNSSFQSTTQDVSSCTQHPQYRNTSVKEKFHR